MSSNKSASFAATVEPSEVGFDPSRLAKIDSHFNRYVDEGRLAGYAVAVARHGRGCIHLN